MLEYTNATFDMSGSAKKKYHWDFMHQKGSHFLLPPRFLEGEIHTQETLIQKLKAWQDVLNLGIESIMRFTKGSLDSFDALVGENRCEIRALLTLNLFKEQNANSVISERLASDIQALWRAKNAVSALIQKGVDESCWESFTKFITTYELDLEISHGGLYLIICRFLTITKEKGLDQIDKTESNLLLSHLPNLSSKQCKRFTYHWQKLLSWFSVMQVAEWGTRLIKDDHHLWMDYLNQDWILSDDKGRCAYPALLGAQIVLDSLKHFVDSPLIIRINVMEGDDYVQTVHLGYKFDKNSNTFTYVGKGEEWLKTLDTSSPAFVVEGCSPATSTMVHPLLGSHVQNIDIEKAILTAFAHKSHYPGQNKGLAPKIIQEILSPIRATFRVNRGCSINDPSLFCVTHIATLSIGELFVERPIHGIPSGLSTAQLERNSR